MDLNMFDFPKLQGGHSLDAELDDELLQMHIHTEVELLYVYEGTLSFHAEGTIYSVRPGDLILFRAAEAHNIIDKASASAYERVTFHIAPILLKETLNGRLLQPFLNRPMGTMNHYRAAELPGEMMRACMRQIFSGCEIRNEMQMLSYVLPILQAVYDAYCKKLVSIPPEPVSSAAQIVAYINSHLFELKDITQLEEEFFLCSSQINRIFHKFMGTSVWHYIKLKRLYTAREMLQSGMTPMSTATACGYQDYSAFFRAYKKQFRSTPKDDFIK